MATQARPSTIASKFCKQFYRCLNQAPERLSQFYDHSSMALQVYQEENFELMGKEDIAERYQTTLPPGVITETSVPISALQSVEGCILISVAGSFIRYSSSPVVEGQQEKVDFSQVFLLTSAQENPQYLYVKNDVLHLHGDWTPLPVEEGEEYLEPDTVQQKPLTDDPFGTSEQPQQSIRRGYPEEAPTASHTGAGTVADHHEMNDDHAGGLPNGVAPTQQQAEAQAHTSEWHAQANRDLKSMLTEMHNKPEEEDEEDEEEENGVEEEEEVEEPTGAEAEDDDPWATQHSPAAQQKTSPPAQQAQQRVTASDGRPSHALPEAGPTNQPPPAAARPSHNYDPDSYLGRLCKDTAGAADAKNLNSKLPKGYAVPPASTSREEPNRGGRRERGDRERDGGFRERGAPRDDRRERGTPPPPKKSANSSAGSCWVWVKANPLHMSDEEYIACLEAYIHTLPGCAAGFVSEVSRPKGKREGGRSSNFAFVKVDSPETRELFVNTNKLRIEDREVVVDFTDFDPQKPQTSQQGETGGRGGGAGGRGGRGGGGGGFRSDRREEGDRNGSERRGGGGERNDRNTRPFGEKRESKGDAPAPATRQTYKPRETGEKSSGGGDRGGRGGGRGGRGGRS
uniref:NTF2 domain-containing protein n=1 Tax=Chromera velia CCMP2878 TaxID=1169474 RepID=A0A0G4I5X4_9ALVE|eukprot:Cvel_11224.t1-p1 / transcript=Cvel_11224.t1 / gene=Cvel_11224 / organism=Chromera_velia_CCMP2878 / gene_product=hypothetical protein / transcript_product=hypothetical protein / location=Cvel_scaffold698:43920-49085(+) / protein_length=625 / sequence_SO=supercontig / SO=protein_coding / is_pseudo=false